MGGDAVAEVVESNIADFKPGDILLVNTGWQTHFVSNGQGVRKLNPADAPTSTALGVLGMPGFTAYGGMKVIGKAKAAKQLLLRPRSRTRVGLAQLDGQFKVVYETPDLIEPNPFPAGYQ